MKTNIPFLFACATLTAATAQHIPDNNFADAIRQDCPPCIDANNDLLPTAQTITSLNVPNKNISDLTGIAGFTSLEVFNCSYNNLSSIPALPATITSFTCSGNQLTSLPVLPAALQYLVCNNNQLVSLPSMPPDLRNLECSYNQLTSLPTMPANMQGIVCRSNQLTSFPTITSNSFTYLDCSYNQLTSLPAMPGILLMVYCNNNQLTSLPSMQGLWTLDCSHNLLTNLPTMGSGLNELDCGNNLLTSLPALPGGMIDLMCDSNQLTTLPALTSLYNLYCQNNQLTSLPALPNDLYELDCRHNQISVLPTLPANLRLLYCNNNLLTSIPTLPQSLESFSCHTNFITSLPNIPASIEFVYCNNNQITSLPPLTGCTALQALRCENNQLTSLPSLADCTWLRYFYCHNNQLTSIPDLSTTEVEYLECHHNQLTSIGELPIYMSHLLCNDNPNLACLPLLPNGIYNLNITNTAITCTPNVTWATAMLPQCNSSNSNCLIYPEISGTVFLDNDSDCQWSGGDVPKQNYLVTATNTSQTTYYAYTDTAGFYQFPVPLGNYILTAHLPYQTGLEQWNCANNIAINAANTAQRDTIDFASEITTYCPYLVVEVGTGFLRRCIDTVYYSVYYANYGTLDAYGSYADITLDPAMVVINSSLPYTAQGSNVYRFQLDTVAVGESGFFYIGIVLDPNCNQTTLGQTHCVEAHIYPDFSSCIANTWAGAAIDVYGDCNHNTAVFTLINVGADMVAPRNYRIFEDGVLIAQGGTFQLQTNETLEISQLALPARAYRIEVQQESGFPQYLGDTVAYATAEACVDSLGFFHLGWVTAYNTNDPAPSVDIDCQQSIGAFDPNDKTGYPTGVGEWGNIAQGQALDYRIRFQNTGTDTAFNIVVVDYLPAELNPMSIEWGAASHPYTHELSPEGMLRLNFSNIQLVDSFTNEPLSHGFVDFRIQQKPNLPLGTYIYNSAAIYFDMNPPVYTNYTLHQIAEDFIQIDLTPTHEPLPNGVQIQVFPNPFRHSVSLYIPNGNYPDLQLFLYDAMGRQVLQQCATSTNRIELQRHQLGCGGVYFYRIESGDKLLGAGKLVAE